MFKRLMGIFTLGAALAPASAQTVWEFSYTGFLDSETNQFQPQWSERGLFAGADNNANGVLELSELTRFSWEQVVYINVDHSWQECMLMQCALEGFRYDLRTGRLDFNSRWSYSDEMAYSTSSTIAGDRISFYGYAGGGGGSSYAWLWTDQTVFNITPAPIPEPAPLPLLLAGMGVLGLAARCRGRGFRSPLWSARPAYLPA